MNADDINKLVKFQNTANLAMFKHIFAEQHGVGPADEIYKQFDTTCGRDLLRFMQNINQYELEVLLEYLDAQD
jgi:hypothetical protein